MPAAANHKTPTAGRAPRHPVLDRATVDDPARYRRWRAQKLDRVRRALAAPVVTIRNPARLEPAELAALGERVGAANFALYRTDQRAAFSHGALIELCRQAGLCRVAANPFSHSSGVSEIRVADDARQRAFAPYSSRALDWHTDGYYDPRRIRGFAMHTVRPAAAGGANRLLDHEVLYLLLRDRDPDLAACLFAPDVLTIPAGRAAGGAPRPAHTGPVFSFGDDGRLHLAFTLRRRHVRWKPSRPVRAARAAMRAILDAADHPYILHHRFAAGEGVICNNVLHCRAAFSDAAGTRGRLVLRARFYDRAGA